MSEPNQINRFGRLVGNSPNMQGVLRLIEKAAKVEMPVLIEGETGTGKDLIARELHDRSERKAGPFVPVNTGAIAHDLIASELFGHVKGAFTGATDDRVGRFKEADGGTLFLDEISTMEDRMQVSLLRILETGKFRPVGAKTDESADVRLIAATNDDLDHAAENGSFREDLLHRLKVLCIQVPALREQVEDIPMLCEHFVHVINEDLHFNLTGISDEAVATLQAYDWPGNTRELKNVIAQAAVMAESGHIDLRHLPERISKLAPGEPVDVEYGTARMSKTPSNQTPSAQGVFMPIGLTLDEVQKKYTLQVLEHCEFNKTRTAEMLGVSRKTLYDKLNRWEQN